MNRFHIKIKKKKTEHGTVLVPKRMFSSCQFYQKIAFGTAITTCQLKAHTVDNESVFIEESLFKEMNFPHESNAIAIPHEDTVYFGPLVGIFTAGFTGSNLRPIGERSMFFAKLLEVEKSVGAYAFVFGSHHINWDQGTVEGYFHTNNGWVKEKIPFPNVVYDRLPNRKTEGHETLKKIKDRLQQEYLIPWFNPGFFNKWEIHEIFEQNETVSEFLPETYPHPTVDKIKEMLNRHKMIYLKPMNGSLGLGIFQVISSQADNSCYCRFHDNGKNFLRKYPSLNQLIEHLFKNRSLSTYIVQQGIRLKRIDQRQTDFRVHTNKDEFGRWRLSAVAIKVAGPGSVTTHLKSGGEVKTLDEVYDRTEKNRIQKKINNAVIHMSETLDERIDGLIGEIGFDIGIDSHDQIWLFEANSKPGRSIFKHPKLKESDFLSRKLPMAYAIYLTEQSIKAPHQIFQRKSHERLHE
jgi:hypothetical protein